MAEKTTPEQICAEGMHDLTYRGKQVTPSHARALADYGVSRLRAVGLLGGDPTEGQIERAEGIYREHVTGYSMRDGGYTYTCRCGESWSGENASTQANHHRMRLALAAAGVAPQEPSCGNAQCVGECGEHGVNLAPQEPNGAEMAQSGLDQQAGTGSPLDLARGPARIEMMPPSPETSARWYSMYCRECGIEEGLAHEHDAPMLIEKRDRHNAEHHAAPQEPSDAWVDRQLAAEVAAKSGLTAPSPDREKLVAEAEALVRRSAATGNPVAEFGVTKEIAFVRGVRWVSELLAAQPVLDHEGEAKAARELIAAIADELTPGRRDKDHRSTGASEEVARPREGG